MLFKYRTVFMMTCYVLFQEVDHFTPKKLIAEDHVPTTSIANLGNFYDPQALGIAN